MADLKGQKRRKSHVQNIEIFLVAQDLVLSHRAKFQLVINFFRVSMFLLYFYRAIISRSELISRSYLNKYTICKRLTRCATPALVEQKTLLSQHSPHAN